MNTLDIYQRFISMKLHFDRNSKYDYFKYKGKSRNITTLNEINSYYASRIKTNFIHNHELLFAYSFARCNTKISLRDVCQEHNLNSFYEFEGYIKSPVYHYIQELQKYDPRELFKTKELPQVLVLYMQDKVTLAFCTLSNILFRYIDKWESSKYNNNDIIQEQFYLIKRISPFLNLTRKDIKTIGMKILEMREDINNK